MIGLGAEEQIDRHALAARLVEGLGKDFPIGELKLAVRRNDVNMVRFELRPLFHLHHRHARARRKHVLQFAAPVGIEMHDDDECGAALVGQRLEHGLQCLHTARGGAHTNDHRTRAGFCPLAAPSSRILHHAFSKESLLRRVRD